MDNKELAKKIIEYVGGKENIQSVTHCITRLRFQLSNRDKVDIKALQNLDDVMGAQYQGGQYQIIIGGKVGRVYKEVAVLLPDLAAGEVQANGNEPKKSIGTRLVDTLSAILVPSLAPVVGGGMLKGLLFLLTTFSWINPEGGTYYILNIASDCMFYFFPFLLAVSSAKKFKTNEYMAISLAGALMYPSILEAAKAGEISSIEFLGFLKIPIIDYSGSIIPIILSVWLMSYVYGFFEDHIPSMITVIFTPLLTLLIMLPIMFFAIAPIGFYIGEYIAIGISWLIDFSPWLAGFVIGASRPLLVLTGMHHAIRPITQQQIATYGFSTMGPMNFMSTMAQASAAFAIYLVIKDKKMKQVSLSSTISGYLGITEPALYGVLIKYRSALLGASLGGGIGGAVGALLGAKSYAPAMPSILSIPVYLGDGTIGFFIGFAVTVVSTIILTLFFSRVFGEQKKKSDSNVTSIFSPVEGTLYSMSDVADETFRSGVLGKGFAIKPSGNMIVAPVNGIVKTVFETKHAIGIVAEDGMEILIHVGIDTVQLEGKYFDSLCQTGDRVQVGDPLLKFNIDKIEEAGYDTTIITVVTNPEKFTFLSEVCPDGTIHRTNEVMTAIV